jgi:Protein of unknown function (DUF3298)
MKIRHAILGAVLVLAGCERGAQAPSAPEAEASAGTIESCPAGSPAALCGDSALMPLHQEVKQRLTAAAEQLSTAGAKIVADNQKSWMEAQRVFCAVDPTAATLTADQETCLKSALSDRAKNAASSVEKVGAYVFQRVEANAAYKVDPNAGGLNALPGGPEAVISQVSYPRLEGDSPAIQAFNRLVAQKPKFTAADATEEQVNYKIAYAGPNLISVRFDKYNNTIGAAHPNTGVDAVNVNMKTGAALAAGDVFAAAGWQDFLAKRAAAGVTKAIRAQDDTARAFAPADLKSAAIDPKNWVVTDSGLTLVFGEDTLGAYALGTQEVTVPWADLKRYLKPDAPVPG